MSQLQHSNQSTKSFVPTYKSSSRSSDMALNKPVRTSTATARYYFELDVSQKHETTFTKVFHTYIDAFDYGVNLYETDEGRTLLHAYIQQKLGVCKIRFYEFL